MSVTVSIIIPVFNKLAFTRQCLERIARHASDRVTHEVIVVDNGSTDGTEYFFRDLSSRDPRVIYIRNAGNEGFARANNAGARRSTSQYLLFLNNDTLVQAGWLEAMVDVAEADARVGIVGIKQLFPYTNTIHHTGIIFTADKRPQHIYPHADGSLPHVNKQREYQAVMGACLLIPRDLFAACGMFDEGYVNGYEDVDLCLTVRDRKRTVICCTSGFIYHYGQITDTRTADDDKNAALFLSKWKDRITPDELDYFRKDQKDIEAPRAAPTPSPVVASNPALVYFADDLSSGSALTWVTSELVLALHRRGVPVAIKKCTLPSSTDPEQRRELETLMLPRQPVGGIQIRWSHYWPQHLGLELKGALNLELFVINYLFERPGSQPWDYWLQSLGQNRYGKLPLSGFCRDVLLQTGVSADQCHIVNPGFSPEILEVAPQKRQDSQLRLLTVTNSHDLERYGTKVLLDAYWNAFSERDDVVLVVKDYGSSSGDTTLPTLLRGKSGRARVEYIDTFTSKKKLIELYKSCDAFVSAHRGEGYGMKLLDALACGLPAITPLFGGPTDFCSPANSYPVDFTLTPVGDCLDTRSLRITNGPVWAEPDKDSLSSQMRAVFTNPTAARQLGEQASRDVLARFTWANTAEQLAAYLASALENPPKTTGASVNKVQAPPAERSPHWMGLRMSVVIPTYNRRESLLRTLRALERQSILPQEFEVLVVDDGSNDGTRELLESEQFAFDLRYYSQSNQGPGTARNLGVRRAQGEFVLFIGDDIIADERLLEEHLVAHAQRREAGAAVLGHIDWLKDLPRSRVMDFVCGDSSLQFAYAHIPKLNALDFRFFYTSNISARRQFLVDAADAGVAFDPDFRYAAFEDSEYAFRLEAWGLSLRYCATALAYHDHAMDLDHFARREYRAGQMAVVFYRKHPQIDDQLQVRWIGDWVDAAERLSDQPDVDARIRALDADTDMFVRSLAESLQQLLHLRLENIPGLRPANFSDAALDGLLNRVLAVAFDVERTRGKVEEWYRGVEDREKIDAAKRLIGLIRKLEFFTVQPTQIEKLKGTIDWLDHEVVGGLRTRVSDLEQQLGLGGSGRRVLGLKRTAWRLARKTDLYIQYRLSGRSDWLGHYHSARLKLKRLARRPDPPR